MKRNTFRLMLLTAVIWLGTLGAWGQTKVNLYSADFETGESSDYWKLGNGTLLTPSYEGTTGRCATIKQSKDRGDYFLTPIDYTDVETYTIEFDFLMAKGSKTANFAIMSQSSWDSWVTNYGYFWKTQTEEQHNPYLFFMSIPSGTTATINENSEINWTFTEKKWYHFKIDVDINNHIITYRVTGHTGASDIVLNGTYTLPEGESALCKGFYERNNRYNYDPGAICIDNVNVYTIKTVDIAQIPSVNLTKVQGTSRIYTVAFAEGETLHYKLPGCDEYLTTTTSPAELLIDNYGLLYTYTTYKSATSEIVETLIEAGSEISLPDIDFDIKNVTEENGECKLAFGASCDNSEVLLKPEIKITADLNGVDVSDAIVAGTFVPENSGTLTITASAEGYVGSSYSTFVASRYSCWSSLDFSTLNADNVAETLGEGWSFDATNERWSSWSNSNTYSHLRYKTNEVTRITINDRLRTRNVVSVNIGYGLGRNANEKVSMLNVTENEITEFKLYNGYGQPVNNATYLSYVISDGNEVAITVNNGCLIVQAKVYSPLVDYSINYVYNGNVVYTEKGRAKKGTVVTATETVTLDEYNKYKVIAEDMPTMAIVDGENVLNVPVRFAGHKQYTNVLYERGTNEETKWTEENLSDFSGNSITLSNYGASYITNANSGDRSTRIISPTPGAIVTLDAYWYGISNLGRKFEDGNGVYFRYGNIFVAQNDQSQQHGYGLDGLDNIANLNRFVIKDSYRGSYDISTKKFLHIEMQINTASDLLIYLRISEEGSDKYLVNVENKQLYDTDYTTLEWGYKKTSSISTERQEYLKSIKITETANVLYERGVYTDWIEADLGSEAWKVTVSDKSYPCSPRIDELGLTLPDNPRNQEITYTMPDAPSEISVISIEAQWYVGGVTDRSGNRTYFAIGNQIEFSAMAKDQKGYVTINGQEYKVTNACLDGNNRTDDTWTIKARINILTNIVESLSIRGSIGKKIAQLDLDNISLSSDAIYNTLKLGCKRSGGYPYTSLKSIIITEEPIQFKYAKDKCTLTSAGIGTLCSQYNLDFTNAENVAAYKAETVEGKIKLTKVNTVAAREGVLIRSLNGGAVTEEIPVAATAYEPNEGNEFIGTLVDIESQPSEDAEYKYYILSSKTVNDAKVYGFYLANNKKIGAGKAYLRVPLAAAAKYSFFSFDDETTGIEDVELGITETDSPVYDLFGRKVVNPATGLYIKNGKKFIVK